MKLNDGAETSSESNCGRGSGDPYGDSEVSSDAGGSGFGAGSSSGFGYTTDSGSAMGVNMRCDTD